MRRIRRSYDGTKDIFGCFCTVCLHFRRFCKNTYNPLGWLELIQPKVLLLFDRSNYYIDLKYDSIYNRKHARFGRPRTVRPFLACHDFFAGYFQHLNSTLIGLFVCLPSCFVASWLILCPARNTRRWAASSTLLPSRAPSHHHHLPQLTSRCVVIVTTNPSNETKVRTKNALQRPRQPPYRSMPLPLVPLLLPHTNTTQRRPAFVVFQRSICSASRFYAGLPPWSPSTSSYVWTFGVGHGKFPLGQQTGERLLLLLV